MSDSEYDPVRTEALFTIDGPPAHRVWEAIAGGRQPAPARLYYLAWLSGAPLLAACWASDSRLELRVVAEGGWPKRLGQLLAELAPDHKTAAFSRRVSGLIARLEAWSYTDQEPTEGVEEMAAELSSLEAEAPSRRAVDEIKVALDALDDGLPAEVVAAALYRARAAVRP